MKKDKLRVEDIKNRFKYQDNFTAQQLYDFYAEGETELNVGTFRWRVYHLKEQGIIANLKRGVYVLENNRIFEPIISSKLVKLYNLIKKQFPYTDILAWDTVWLHEYMIHQPASSLAIIEVEKQAINAVFEMLRNKWQNVFIYAKKHELDHVFSSNNPVVIKPYLKESPTNIKGGIIVPKIEKILVDLFFEKPLYITYHGHEMINIFENIFDKYSVNITTLYRYSKQRSIKENLRKFITSQVNIDKKYL
ncbi:MAG: DUF6577 family protein [Desulfocucumaceae bacterium]